MQLYYGMGNVLVKETDVQSVLRGFVLMGVN